MRMFGCTAYAHKHETQISSKVDSRAEMGVDMGSQENKYGMYYRGKRNLLLTKHGAFGEHRFLLLSQQARSVYVEQCILSDSERMIR